MGWREENATEKQLKMISDMNDFSEYQLPKFTGTTKGEASDYINRYIGLSHESILGLDESRGKL